MPCFLLGEQPAGDVFLGAETAVRHGALVGGIGLLEFGGTTFRAGGLEDGEHLFPEFVGEAAGAVEVFQSARPYSGWHLLGTARMGCDPETSVVNEWGRAHDVRNLFVIDGSVFVTAAAVNPTRTIQALALYIADEIKSRLAEASLFD